MLYRSGEPVVDVYGRLALVMPRHTVGLVPKVIVVAVQAFPTAKSLIPLKLVPVILWLAVSTVVDVVGALQVLPVNLRKMKLDSSVPARISLAAYWKVAMYDVGVSPLAARFQERLTSLVASMPEPALHMTTASDAVV